MLFSLRRKLRQPAWVIRGLFTRYKKIIWISLFLGVVGFLLLGKFSYLFPHLKKTERIGIIGVYSAEDLPDEIKRVLSSGLTTIATDGSPQPDLAKEWQVSDDHLVYTFTLRENLFWQDGSKLIASSLSFNFEDIKIEYINEGTIKFFLKEPYSPFPGILSQPLFKKQFLGTNPVKIKKIKESKGKVELLKISTPEVDVFYRFYPTLQEATMGFKMGQIDVIRGVFQNPFDESWNKKIKIEESIKKNHFLAIFYNTGDPLLGSKILRQALTYSVKKPSNPEERATGPISSNSWAYNNEVKPYDYDPQKAKELFSKFLEEQEISAKDVSFKIFTTQPFLRKAEEIKNDWQSSFNIDVQVQLINFFTPDYQIFLGVQNIPPDPDQYALWHSTVKESNITNFKSIKIDKLLEDGRRIYAEDKRKEKYFDFQKFLIEECPVAFITYPKSLTIKRV